MKLKLIATALLFSVACAGTVPVKAQTATDPCTVFICMAGMAGPYGKTGGPACTPAITYWHTALAVYNPYFNSGASAARRRTYLMSCPGANTGTNVAVLNTIINNLGYNP